MLELSLQGLDLNAKANNIAGYYATENACPPLLSIERKGRTSCDAFNQKILNFINENPQITTVILKGRWQISFHGTRYKKEKSSPVELIDLKPNSNNLNNQAIFKTGYTRTIDALIASGKKVIVILSTPEVGHHVPANALIANLRGVDINSLIAPTIPEFRERTGDIHAFFHQYASSKDITFISPSNLLCKQNYCEIESQGNLIYRDDNHLSTYGSVYISEIFDPVFNTTIKIKKDD